MRNRKSIADQGNFLTRISELLTNGFSISEAIQFLQHIDPKGNYFSHFILEELQKGIPLHEVLLKEKFDKNACSQIYFAEKHGHMIEALKEAGNYLLKKHKDITTLWKLLRYPILLLIILFIVVSLLKTILLPQFESIYESLNYTPTKQLQLFLYLMQHIPNYFLYFILLFIIMFLTFFSYIYRKSPIERARWLSKIPFYNFYYKHYNSQFLAREWSFLLKSGFSIHEILLLMESQHFRPLLRDTAKELHHQLLLGKTISEAFTNIVFIEKQFVILIRHGEKNGKLDQELFYYSQISLKRMEEHIHTIFQIIQPIIFMIIGIFLIAIYMSILFPMFQMIDAV
ncbi:competence type IV pilus assembly protein ComGB [Heyndrickxia ginsengihumi]|uniref:competence type IV pilus assembly protein ComGB n=1 Tax=Heyndrickxia ginsengihumi TaxID=363870 RepID=UPI0009DD490F|nr:competence type IV pilus assembly protein ComGB [Heyndrickxia ginsengihumi]MBE6183764.1 type II secretion system F family protein [Bacillus sp. (in: firmicutes)]MCM3022776.1 type II secretion system F family protein [Heyndrickxia ginsengihumi]